VFRTQRPGRQASRFRIFGFANTVDYQRYSAATAKPDGKKYRIVFLGRLVPRKGCLELLQAVQKLVARGAISNLEVIVGGKGPQLERLEEFVAKHNLQEVVRFVGYVSEDDKPNFCVRQISPFSQVLAAKVLA